MIRLDHQYLVDLGLGHLEDREQEILTRRIYEVLQLRVGLVLTTSLTRSQRQTFEQILSAEDEEAAYNFLSGVVPNYATAVRNELELIASTIEESVRRGTVTYAELGGGADDDG